MDLKEICAKIISLLEQSDLSPVFIETWFDELEILEITDDTIVFYTPTPFKRDFIKSRCFTELSDAAETLFNGKMKITILAGSDEVKAYREESASLSTERAENDHYTFKYFIVGASNRFAHAAAMAVAQNPGSANKPSAYNPLFIYGRSGLGKTHLLYAIAGEVEHRYPDYKIVYTKGADFLNEVITSLGKQKIEEMRQKYRQADLLLVDDVHFIAGKERTEEEFFHIFNELYENKKQIVLTSDRPPRDIPSLQERLVSRFEWGLLADIQPPDFETRVAIIHSKSQLMNFPLPEKVEFYIADTVLNNIRQLESAVNKIRALHELNGLPVTVEMAEKAVEDLIHDPSATPITVPRILNEVSSYYSIKPDRIISLNRAKDTVLPRYVAIFLVREMTDLSTLEIGKEFGRDHSTILYAIKKIQDQILSDPSLESALNDIKTNLLEK